MKFPSTSFACVLMLLLFSSFTPHKSHIKNLLRCRRRRHYRCSRASALSVVGIISQHPKCGRLAHTTARTFGARFYWERFGAWFGADDDDNQDVSLRIHKHSVCVSVFVRAKCPGSPTLCDARNVAQTVCVCVCRAVLSCSALARAYQI